MMVMKPNLRNNMVTAVHWQFSAQSSNLLPFLYQTRSILALAPVKQYTTASSHASNCRSFTSASRGQAETQRYWRSHLTGGKDHVLMNIGDDGYSKDTGRYWRPPVTDGEGHVLMKIGDDGNSKTKPQVKDTGPHSENDSTRRSTMTNSERAVFDRIAKDISQSSSIDVDEDDMIEPYNEEYDANEYIDDIFDKAIKVLQLREEQSAEGASRSRVLAPSLPAERALDTLISGDEHAAHHRVFKRPLNSANGLLFDENVKTEEERKALVGAANDHRAMVISMLRKAQSDWEIWQVLDTEVFSLVNQLHTHSKTQGKARKSAKASTDAEKKGPGGKGRFTRNSLLSILQRNYAEYALTAVRQLRQHHPTSSYAFHVLTAIKSHGPISYALGASTDLYNEILFLKWTQYAELHGLADTIEETINRGIDSNEVTLVLIREIGKQRWRGKVGRLGPVVKAWWYLRSTVEGWKRLFDLYVKLKADIAEREEMGSGREEMGSGREEMS